MRYGNQIKRNPHVICKYCIALCSQCESFAKRTWARSLQRSIKKKKTSTSRNPAELTFFYDNVLLVGIIRTQCRNFFILYINAPPVKDVEKYILLLLQNGSDSSMILLEFTLLELGRSLPYLFDNFFLVPSSKYPK